MYCRVFNIISVFFVSILVIVNCNDSDDEDENWVVAWNHDKEIFLTKFVRRPGNNVEESITLGYDTDAGSTDNEDGKRPLNDKKKDSKTDCWVTLNAKNLFNAMDPLDERYANVRKQYQAIVGTDEFDKKMLDTMIKTRAAAERAIHNFKGRPARIPAGISLGGHCMMRLQESILFFQRLKLRNDTVFRVNYLHNDLVNMKLIGRLSLNDLHLVGSYERALTDRDPSHLIYRPTFGQLEILLKNVEYKMEGRYRMMKDRLMIELIVSELKVPEILLTYHNNASSIETERLEHKHIDEYLERLKRDLNEWLKDYFNDYLMYVELDGKHSNAEFLMYDKEKAMVLNEYTDEAIDLMKMRLHDLKATAVKIPNFRIFSINGLEMKLKNGVLWGLDSMHRRSVATGEKNGHVRQVDAIIGFSKLKLQYRYEALLNPEYPPLSGLFILSADELTAHLGMSLVHDPETVDLVFNNLHMHKPAALTVEGSINRMIGNFRHLMENHIISIMSNMMIHHVRMLSTLTKCEPLLPPYIEEGEIFSEEQHSQDGDNYEAGNVGDGGKQMGDDDYAIIRKDSIEIEMPAGGLNKEPKTMVLKYDQKFSINEKKD